MANVADNIDDDSDSQENGIFNNTRRQFVAGSAALGGIAVSTGFAMPSLAQDDEEAAPPEPIENEFEDDVDILNFALTLERLEAEFYRQGLENFDESDFTLEEPSGEDLGEETDDEMGNESEDDEIGNETEDDAMGNESEDDAMGNESEDDAMGNESEDDAMGNESEDDAMGNESEEETNETASEQIVGSTAQDDDEMGNESEDDEMGNETQDDEMGNETQDDELGNETEDDGMGNETEGEEIGNETQDDELGNETEDDGMGNATEDEGMGEAAAEEETEQADQPYGELQKILEHEEAHVETLETTIEDLGGEVAPEPEVDFGTAVEDPMEFIGTAVQLEDIGVSAYAGAAPFIQNDDLVAPALSIHSVEGRHAAYVRTLMGLTSYPNAFDEARSRSEVLELAGSFITNIEEFEPAEEATTTEEGATPEISIEEFRNQTEDGEVGNETEGGIGNETDGGMGNETDGGMGNATDDGMGNETDSGMGNATGGNETGGNATGENSTDA